MAQQSKASDGAGTDTIEIGIAEYAVTDNGSELSTYGLGSCVAIALFDVENEISGLAHVMLPRSDAAEGEAPGKFADTAVRAMLTEMEELGATKAHVRAKVVGGSEMFDFTGIAEGVGRRNVEAAKKTLKAAGIPIDAEDVGGDHGRSVTFDGETGTLTMKTADDGIEEL
jgi:chemotaxis protein CheD